MPSAFEILAADHEEVKRLLTELELGPSAATGASYDQLLVRQMIVRRLVAEESRHEAIEDMCFWPAVRRVLEDGDDLANQAQQQEQEAKQVLDRLDGLTDDEDLEDQLTQFIRAGREHIAFEESVVWPSLQDALSAEQAGQLGRDLLEARQKAPARPHPKIPASPAVLKTAGPVIAAADRLRDAAAGRGQ